MSMENNRKNISNDICRSFDMYRIDKLLINKQYLSLLNRIMSLHNNDFTFSQFERLFSNYIGRKYALLVDSGSRALKIALQVLGIKKGDEIMLSNITHYSLLDSMKFCEARPILIGVNNHNLNIDTNRLRRKISPKTKIMLITHMFGNPCDMDKIKEMASEYGILIIEDASQALGGVYKNKKLGCFGDISVFSLSSYKPVSAPGSKAGIFLCDNKKIYTEALKIVKDRYYRPSLMIMPFLTEKLKIIDTIISDIKKINNIYRVELSKLKRYVKTFTTKESIAQEYPILVLKRNELKRNLFKMKIPLERLYTPLNRLLGDHLNKFYVSEQYYNNSIHLPTFPLMTYQECRNITEQIGRFYGIK